MNGTHTSPGVESDWRITAYALGELEGDALSEFEGALALDPALAAEVAAIRVTAQALESAFGDEPNTGLTETQRAAIDAGAGKARLTALPGGLPTGASASRHSRTRRAIVAFSGLAVAAGIAAAVVVSQRPHEERRAPSDVALSPTPSPTAEDRASQVTSPPVSPGATPGAPASKAQLEAGVVAAVPARVQDNGGRWTGGAAPEPAPVVSTVTGAPKKPEADPNDNTATPAEEPVAAKGDSERESARPKDSGAVAAPMVEKPVDGPAPVAPVGALSGPVSGPLAERLLNDKDESAGAGGLGKTRSSVGLTGTPAGGGGHGTTDSLAGLAGTKSARPELADPVPGQDWRGRHGGYGQPLQPRRPAPSDAYEAVHDHPFMDAATVPLSTFGLDVDTASYANVRRFLNQSRLPPPAAVRIEELVNYFPYELAAPAGPHPVAVHVEVANAPWAEGHRLVKVGLRARDLDPSVRLRSNLVFLVDVSGSMQPQNRLPLVKEGLRMLTEQLSGDDRVAIVTYAGTSGVALHSTTGSDKASIQSAIAGLQAGGSTNGGQGIHTAYSIAQQHFVKGGVNRVILATDGDFNVGVTNREQLTQIVQARAKSGVFLTVLGVGMGNFKDATLEKLADKGNGNYAYIDSLAEAKKVLVDEVRGTLATVAKDVKLQLEFNPKTVASYRQIGYENRAMAARDFRDDRKDGGELGAGHVVTALYEVVPRAGHDGVPLKYQDGPAGVSGELLTVHVRYKQPDGEISRELEVPVRDAGTRFASGSKDLRFAAAVAGFGMLLRGSPYRGTTTWANVEGWAEDALGADAKGYRSEFLGLVKRARSLSGFAQ